MRALGLPAEDYAVFGSAPLLACGLIDEVSDVDLIATCSAWRLARKLASPTRAPGGDWVVRVDPNLEIYNGWLGLDVDAIVRRAESIDGLPVACLSDVAAYKHLPNRPKDRLHLELLKAHLRR